MPAMAFTFCCNFALLVYTGAFDQQQFRVLMNKDMHVLRILSLF